MKICVICGRILFVSFVAVGTARADFREFREIPTDKALGEALTRTAEASMKEFPQLTPENLALSLIDLTNADAPKRADYNGDARFYPASVIKLFFMVEVFHQGKHTPEIDRALREMIAVSDNDATAYLVDVISGTTSGPELEGKALEEFIERRRTINHHFESLGYDISAMAKPWSFGPFGREMQLLGPSRENRNRATANSVTSVLHWIVRKRAVSPNASEAMLKLLERPLNPIRSDENQIKDFFGESLPPGARLWSKSGETSEVRHDTAYVELPNGRKFIIVIFTRVGEVKPLLPAIGRHLIRNVSE